MIMTLFQLGHRCSPANGPNYVGLKTLAKLSLICLKIVKFAVKT